MVINFLLIIVSSDSRDTTIAFFWLAFAFCGINGASAGATDPLVAFAGSTKCINCHQEIYDDWRQSDHHKAMQFATPENVLGNFDNN